MLMKGYLLDFGHDVRRICNQMAVRVMQQNAKMQHLHFLFEREAERMKVFCKQKFKVKKYRHMLTNLHTIEAHHKAILLREYF